MGYVMSNKGLQDKTQQIFSYLDKGLTMEEARQLVEPGKEVSRQADYKLSKKYAAYSLTNPKRAKKAALTVDKILQGKTIGDAKQPNTSDILKAAEMILDRTDPKVTLNHNINENISLSPVNLDSYRTIEVLED